MYRLPSLLPRRPIGPRSALFRLPATSRAIVVGRPFASATPPPPSESGKPTIPSSEAERSEVASATAADEAKAALQKGAAADKKKSPAEPKEGDKDASSTASDAAADDKPFSLEGFFGNPAKADSGKSAAAEDGEEASSSTDKKAGGDKLGSKKKKAADDFKNGFFSGGAGANGTPGAPSNRSLFLWGVG